MRSIFNLERSEQLEILENAISWIVVMAMLVYGFGKIVQFDGATEVYKTVDEMTGMELMWAFYGYSKPFILTMGLFEIIGGLLILIKKTRIIGCFFTSTILINIILQDIFYEVHVGALKAAIIYQILIMIILWLNKAKVIKALKTLLIHSVKKVQLSKQLVMWIFAFSLFVILRIAEYYITIKW